MEIKCVYATETPREIESVYDSNKFFCICERKFILFIIVIKILVYIKMILHTKTTNNILFYTFCFPPFVIICISQWSNHLIKLTARIWKQSIDLVTFFLRLYLSFYFYRLYNTISIIKTWWRWVYYVLYLCCLLLSAVGSAVDRITRTENVQKIQKQQITTFEGHFAVFGQIRNMKSTRKN